MQSLDRVMRILESVAGQPQASGAAEVAERTGLALSTVARLMGQLADASLLHRSRDRRYTLGPRLYSLARAAGSQLDAVAVARPVVEQLRDVTGETASMHVLRGRLRVCVVEAPSHHQVRRVVPVGLAEPLGGSATGAVLLADGPPDERREQLEALEPAKRQRFEKLIEHARSAGWALVVDEWSSGLAGLSAAVRDGDSTLAAISVSGPSARFTREVGLSHVDDVLNAARTISTRIGLSGA